MVLGAVHESDFASYEPGNAGTEDDEIEDDETQLFKKSVEYSDSRSDVEKDNTSGNLAQWRASCLVVPDRMQCPPHLR